MPKLVRSQPTYRKHKASGQAIVLIDGKMHYLGPHGSKASRDEYDRLVGEWLANGRRAKPVESTVEDEGPTIIELAAAYLRWARGYYRKRGELTRSYGRAKAAMQVLLDSFGQIHAKNFGPLGLKGIQQKLIREGTGPGRRPNRPKRTLSRSYVNDLTSTIRHSFRWAVAEQMIPVAVHQALMTVDNLRKDRSTAREPAPVVAVSDAAIDAILPHLPPVVADIVRFARYTGCRPGEATAVRPADVDRSAEIWIYTPASHKTEHHNRQRRVAIGPRAKAILRQYLHRDAESYCFQPAESRRRQLDAMRAARRTKVQPSQTDRRKQNAKRRPGERYDRNALNHAIARACDRAGIPRWHSNQLRHTFATAARRQQFGLHEIQASLGHSHVRATEVYSAVNDGGGWVPSDGMNQSTTGRVTHYKVGAAEAYTYR